MTIFLAISKEIGCPISEEKTIWPDCIVTFLGMLLNGYVKSLSVPEDKIVKARNMLEYAIDNKKVTVKFVQQLTGVLNFLNRAIVPGRAFTRGMYSKLSVKFHNNKNVVLKQHHHLHLNADFLQDCCVWLKFLKQASSHETRICRPFLDFSPGGSAQNAEILNFYSDASKRHNFGIGAVFNNHWIKGVWTADFIKKADPSIEFLELYAVTIALYTWRSMPELNNGRVVLFCDNQAVQHMINNLASSCPQCMKLIRLIALLGIQNNIRVFVDYVRTTDDILADSLSRDDMKRFWANAPRTMYKLQDNKPNFLWPETKIWYTKFSQLCNF